MNQDFWETLSKDINRGFIATNRQDFIRACQQRIRAPVMDEDINEIDTFTYIREKDDYAFNIEALYGSSCEGEVRQFESMIKQIYKNPEDNDVYNKNFTFPEDLRKAMDKLPEYEFYEEYYGSLVENIKLTEITSNSDHITFTPKWFWANPLNKKTTTLDEPYTVFMLGSLTSVITQNKRVYSQIRIFIKHRWDVSCLVTMDHSHYASKKNCRTIMSHDDYQSSEECSKTCLHDLDPTNPSPLHQYLVMQFNHIFTTTQSSGGFDFSYTQLIDEDNGYIMCPECGIITIYGKSGPHNCDNNIPQTCKNGHIIVTGDHEYRWDAILLRNGKNWTSKRQKLPEHNALFKQQNPDATIACPLNYDMLLKGRIMLLTIPYAHASFSCLHNLDVFKRYTLYFYDNHEECIISVNDGYNHLMSYKRLDDEN
ncbi:12720_t:CDS:2 [Dentiscutata heterogama]|uniref:12720_t:CDS:1 n=1 Tax=Dentiscutata heterogama TaxID=1316150 RepID=A0ACA9KRM8_9GLOM|nr:12720_t:CDS:2 [Dentiscutata heterogama]